MVSESTFLLLLVIAVAVAILAHRVHLPYTAALVLAGLGIGAAHLLAPPHLTQELLYGVFLPGLVFEAAFHLEYQGYRENKLAILSLAVPGVIAASALTAFLLQSEMRGVTTGDWGFGEALVFGALISATDPIAVVAVFRRLGVPKRLSVLVEGESLLNDGTAAVLFTVVLAAIAAGHAELTHSLVEFSRIVGAGILVGAGLGYAMSRITAFVDEPMIEITLTTISAWGSFAIAEHLGGSGVLATVVAGMLSGNYAARTGMSASTRVAVESFWEYVAFAFNSFVFLLIGFDVPIGNLLASWKGILLAYFAVTAGRALVLAGTTAALGRTKEKVPWPWTAVLAWGGMRGGLAVVLVLGLPDSFPHRDELVAMTWGVVLISIVVQGTTMPWLLKALKIGGADQTREKYEESLAQFRAASAARDRLEALARERLVHGEVLRRLRDEYDRRVETAESGILVLHRESPALQHDEESKTRRELLLVEKDAVLDAARKGLLGTKVQARALSSIDERLESARNLAPTHPAPAAAPDAGADTAEADADPPRDKTSAT